MPLADIPANLVTMLDNAVKAGDAIHALKKWGSTIQLGTRLKLIADPTPLDGGALTDAASVAVATTAPGRTDYTLNVGTETRELAPSGTGTAYVTVTIAATGGLTFPTGMRVAGTVPAAGLCAVTFLYNAAEAQFHAAVGELAVSA
jgi:hypothetical protein